MVLVIEAKCNLWDIENCEKAVAGYLGNQTNK
jgi:hypothetical protein